MGRKPGSGSRVRALTYFRFAGDEFAVLSIPRVPRLPSSLTPAEREVAALLFAGKSNAAIARSRGVAVRTIANQVASILKKLRVGSRAELIAQLGARRR